MKWNIFRNTLKHISKVQRIHNNWDQQQEDGPKQGVDQDIFWFDTRYC